MNAKAASGIVEELEVLMEALSVGSPAEDELSDTPESPSVLLQKPAGKELLPVKAVKRIKPAKTSVARASPDPTPFKQKTLQRAIHEPKADESSSAVQQVSTAVWDIVTDFELQQSSSRMAFNPLCPEHLESVSKVLS